MDEKERLRLQEAYRELPENELIEMLLIDQSEYQKEIYELLLEEAERRNINDKLERERKRQKRKENEEKTKKRYSFFSKTPSSLFEGAFWLLFISISNLIAYYITSLPEDKASYIITFIIFLILGIGAFKSSLCLYIGLVIWVIDFSTGWYSRIVNDLPMPQALTVGKLWLTWELIRATPLYARLYFRKRIRGEKG